MLIYGLLKKLSFIYFIDNIDIYVSLYHRRLQEYYIMFKFELTVVIIIVSKVVQSPQFEQY